MRTACFACAAAILAGLSLWPAAWGFAHAEVGSVIEDVEMPTIDGGMRHLLTNASVNVFVFFKPGQEHSRATMAKLARLEEETAGKSVHWAGIVSDTIPRADADAEVRKAGIRMPVLVDVGDALYGRLGVALQPVVGITDKDHILVVYQPFTKVHYIEVIRARIRHLLKEIDDRELAKTLHPPAATSGGDAAAARRRFKLAERLFRSKNYEKALESVNIVIEKDPALAEAHALIGDILTARGNCPEALTAYRRALELDPADARAIRGTQTCQGAGRKQ